MPPDFSRAPLALALLALLVGLSATGILSILEASLVVAGPGRYRYGDFARLGLPLSLVVGVVAVVLIPFIWAF